MSLSNATVYLAVGGQVKYGTAGSLGSGSIGGDAVSTNYDVGTGANAVDVPYIASITVTNPTTTSIDMRGGTIVQPGDSGTTIASFVKIRTLKLTYKSGTGVLTYGGGSNAIPGVSGTLENVGDVALIHKPVGGIAVTAGTGDLLNLSSSAGAIGVDITAFGTSA